LIEIQTESVVVLSRFRSDDMSIFEAIMIMLTFGLVVIALVKSDSNTKK